MTTSKQAADLSETAAALRRRELELASAFVAAAQSRFAGDRRPPLISDV